MEDHNDGQELNEAGRGAIDRARAAAAKAIGQAPTIAGNARDGAEQVAQALPGAFDTLRLEAGSTVTRMQTMSDSTLQLVVASSLGLGAGLRLAGAPLLVTLAGFAPASIFGFAILSRPRRSHHAARP